MKEFKKYTTPTTTRYVLESMTAGATGASNIATSDGSVGSMIKRQQESKTDKVPQKPRQGPLRPQTGGGRHKDKKRADKQGQAKHKKPYYEDHEVSMASNELKSIHANARKLLGLVQQYGEQGDLEAWQQSKITKAADYLTSVLQSIGGKQDELDEQGLQELEKPSGTMFLKFIKKQLPDREMALYAFAGFGNTPEDVRVANAKIKPFIVQSVDDLEDNVNKIFRDVDFVGVEKMVVDGRNIPDGMMPDVEALIDLDERLEFYVDDSEDDEQDSGGGKMQHYVIGPDGKKRKVPVPGKPSAQVAGSSHGTTAQPKTYTYTLQKTDLGPKLRSMGFKIDGNKVVLTQKQRDQLVDKLGSQFQSIFGQGGKFTEGDRDDQFSLGGRMPATDRIPQDSTAGQNREQAIIHRMKQQTIDRILNIKPEWGRSDLELMTAAELNQILRDIQGQSEGVQKKPNATTRHLRDYPVSDKDVAKPVKKPEKKKPEQGVAEGSDKLQGTPVVSLSDFSDKDNKKNKYGQTVPKKLKKDDPRVKFHKDEKKGVAEDSDYMTDNMVSHITQIITHLDQQGGGSGDRNTFMKLVARKMPRIVQDNPKLFRRAFGIAYDRFFHIDQDDDDFDYTDYSMRKGERGLEEDKQKGVDGKACWKGYKRMGTKKKGGRTVDNCVKVGEDNYTESLWAQLDEYKFTSLPYKGQKKEKKAPYALGSKHIGKGKETNRAGLSGIKANTQSGQKPVVDVEENLAEKAPPGDKYERMVKHIKKGYAKDGKLSDKERSIAYATAWKAKNKSKK